MAYSSARSTLPRWIGRISVRSIPPPQQQHQEGDQDGHHRRQAQPRNDQIIDIAAEHIEFAVREIDDPQHAEMIDSPKAVRA